ncbi:Ubiquitin-like protein 7 [Lonchura striata]|uniref:Ubiquitin-like protein 7 n=1 Tax=Lonchura striata TaxID=40157 RepID=A0A218UA00_9PASE|nr:Ubiquitin-like protein 7 [Lonchura striata domestica]
MALPEWHIAVKLAEQPLAPKSILRLPETELGECPLGGCSILHLKQLITGKLQESMPDPELIDLIYCGRKLRDDQTLDFYGIQSGSTVHVLRKSWPEPDQKPEPVDKVAAVREFRVLHTALHSSPAYRDAVFKMLGNKESLDQIIVATPGLSSDPVALGECGCDPEDLRKGVLQDKDLFSVFADPNMLDTVQSGTPITNDLFSQALQHALQASGQPSLQQSQWQPQLQQLRDMGIHDDELSLRALQATGGDIQAALELIFAGGAP